MPASRSAGPVAWGSAKPFVLLVIGVNGSGKTTTIGKLAALLSAQGKKVILGAGDTFRAAAAEQLEIWGKRTGAPVVRGKEGADPSSVLFDAIKRATNEGFDVVIGDTAGRLHTKTDLMEELQKVRRVIGKAAPGAPHETWLVIDSTSGQNAIAQAQIFTQAMAVSGIVLTKLDGTAKGGVILGIADQLQIPVRFIGIGERVEDLREFDADDFVEALFERDSGGGAGSGHWIAVSRPTDGSIFICVAKNARDIVRKPFGCTVKRLKSLTFLSPCQLRFKSEEP